jgi:AcrR family transcriptional regulator
MPPTPPPNTRRKILLFAFEEFYHHGFQGGSLNRIVETAGVAKGALFHHFAGKRELGYAVIDEIIGPILESRWLAPLAGAADPAAVIAGLFRRTVNQDVRSGSWIHGCPLNNLAQEMSPLDEGFRSRIDALYSAWRKCYTDALAAGVRSGAIRPHVDPSQAATLLVAAQMGVWGTAKSSQNRDLMRQAAAAVCAYLEGLRTQPTLRTQKGETP